MSKRLQVLVDERELKEIRRVASREHLTVAEWVRQTLRAGYREKPVFGTDRKLAVIRAAAKLSYPTADIEEMLAEIERGYGAAK